jgi:hypothetical protein
MKRGFRLSNDLNSSLADVPAAESFESFRKQMPGYSGNDITQADFDYFRGLPPDQLAA